MLTASSPAVSPLEPLPRLRAVTQSRGYDYLLSLPPQAPAGAGLRAPLLLFLHGAAERGAAVGDVARHGLPRLLTSGPGLTPAEKEIGDDVAGRFVVIAPQCAHFEVWNDAALLTLLDDVVRDYPVDPTRVYLTGMSMGGFGTWSLGLRHPERFAALAPICGGGRISDVTNASTHHGAELARLGVWAFHGAKDRIVPVEESERMIDALRRAGVKDVKFTVYPDAEHDAWTAAYQNPDLYRWLLRHAS